jgi:hypothetical protein
MIGRRAGHIGSHSARSGGGVTGTEGCNSARANLGEGRDNNVSSTDKTGRHLEIRGAD